MNFVTVTAAARSKLLCRIHDVKDKLGVSGVADDAEIQRLIEATGAEFSSVLGREPWHQTYQERLPGEGGIYLPLSRWPVDNVASVSESGTAVDAADYEIGGTRRDRVYREDGWTFTSARRTWHTHLAGDEDLTYEVAYSAGWIMPNQLRNWDGGQAYAVGDWVLASDPTIVALFECTTAGTSDTTEPTWDETEGNTTADNTATWTARGAERLPSDIEQAAIMRCVDLYRESISDPAIASESFDGMRIQYRDTKRTVSAGIVSLLKQYT